MPEGMPSRIASACLKACPELAEGPALSLSKGQTLIRTSAVGSALPLRLSPYNRGSVERKIFWTSFILLSLLADFSLPLLWGALATIPIALVSWWVAYRSGWF